MQMAPPDTLREFIAKLSSLLASKNEISRIPLTLVNHYITEEHYHPLKAIVEARFTRIQLLLLNPQ